MMHAIVIDLAGTNTVLHADSSVNKAYNYVSSRVFHSRSDVCLTQIKRTHRQSDIPITKSWAQDCGDLLWTCQLATGFDQQTS